MRFPAAAAIALVTVLHTAVSGIYHEFDPLRADPCYREIEATIFSPSVP